MLQRLIFRPIVEVLRLSRVAGKIVELELLRLHYVMDQLVALGADTVVGANAFRIRPLEIFVKPFLAEGRVGSFCQRKNAFSLHVLWNRHAGKIEKGWRQVGIENHLIADCSGGNALGIANHQWHADRWLVHQALIEEAPFAKEKSMVRTLHDGGVVENIFLFEIAEDAADVLVHRYQTGVVVFHDAFMRSTGNVRRGGSDLVLGIDKTFWLSRISFQVIVKSCRLRNCGFAVKIEMTPCPEKRLVRRNEPDEQAEGFVAAIFFEPCQG